MAGLPFEQYEVDVVGLDTGATVVVKSDSIDSELRIFLHHLSTHPHRPVHPRTGTIWRPPVDAIEARMQELGVTPTRRRNWFLDDLDFFLEELYGPEWGQRFFRPGVRGSTTMLEQQVVVNSRVFAYLRHTRRVPSDDATWRDSMDFVMWYLNMIG